MFYDYRQKVGLNSAWCEGRSLRCIWRQSHQIESSASEARLYCTVAVFLTRICQLYFSTVFLNPCRWKAAHARPEADARATGCLGSGQSLVQSSQAASTFPLGLRFLRLTLTLYSLPLLFFSRPDLICSPRHCGSLNQAKFMPLAL